MNLDLFAGTPGSGASWLLLRRSNGISTTLGRRAHPCDRRGQESPVLDRSFCPDHIADLDVAEGDGVVPLAEGRVLIGDEGVGCVIRAALQCHCHVIDGGDFAAEIGQDPAPLALLDGLDLELGQLVPPQGAADQKRQDDVVALPLEGGAVGLFLPNASKR